MLEKKVKGLNTKLSSLNLTVQDMRNKAQQIHNKLNKDFLNLALIAEEKEALIQLKKWEVINKGVIIQKSRAT